MLKGSLYWLLLEEQTLCFWKTFSTDSFMLHPTLNDKFFTGLSGHSENDFWVNHSSKYLFLVFRFLSQYPGAQREHGKHQILLSIKRNEATWEQKILSLKWFLYIISECAFSFVLIFFVPSTYNILIISYILFVAITSWKMLGWVKKHDLQVF